MHYPPPDLLSSRFRSFNMLRWSSFLKFASGVILVVASLPSVVRSDPPAGNKYTPTQEELAKAYQRANQFPGRRTGGVYKSQITPHWFPDGTRFWYRNDLAGGTREFILIDAARGTRGPAFDHDKLATALSKAADKEYKSDRLPFESIEFMDDGKAIVFKAGDVTWKGDLAGYECSRVGKDSKPSEEKRSDPAKPEDSELALLESP